VQASVTIPDIVPVPACANELPTIKKVAASTTTIAVRIVRFKVFSPSVIVES
jgi:hypothetical protein